MKRISLILGAMLALGLVAWLFWPAPKSQPISDTLSVPEALDLIPTYSEEPITEGEWVSPIITYDTYESEYGKLPASLEDTQIPFNLQVDDQGNLIVNSDLRRFFDYFFTTQGEEDLGRILARVEELLQKYLPESASYRAIEILHQYFNLKASEIELSQQIDADFKASGEQPSPWEIKRLLRDLRATNLDQEVYDAFFGVENQRDDYTLYRLQIQQDTSLTEEERQAALIEIEQYLPPSEQEQLKEEREIQQVYSDVDAAKADGASEAEIFNIRAQAFGAEAAERYAESDKQIASWDARVDAYRAERAAVLSMEGLTEDDKEAQIEALRQQHFEGNELRRIPVIDLMKDAENQ